MNLTPLAEAVADLNAEKSRIDVGADIIFRDVGSGQALHGLVVGVADSGFEVMSGRDGRREYVVDERDILIVKWDYEE